jgi:hypothetical protein
MPNNQYYVGAASPIAQIDAFTVASPTAADAYLLTVKDEGGNTLTTVSYTVPGSPTAAGVATAIANAWNTNAIAQAIAIASTSSAILLLTSDNPGIRQYVTSSVTGTGTFTKSSAGSNGAMDNSGPCDGQTAANWSLGVLPATGDTVTLDGRMQAQLLYGLNFSAVTLAALYVDLASQNVGQQKFPLRISATSWLIGRNLLGGTSIRGAGRINIDFGTVASTGLVSASNNQPADTGQETVRIKGTNASNIWGVSGGVVGIGTNLPADTATVPSITCSGGILNIASGVTATTVVNDGGKMTLSCAATTVTNQSGNGTITTFGTGLLTTVNAIGGTIFLGNRAASGNSVTTLNNLGGTADASVDPRPVTIGTWNFSNGSLVQAYANQLTISTTSIAFGNLDTFTGSTS